MLQPLPGKLRDTVLERPAVTWLVVAVNLAGTGFGFYYYREQFAATAPHLWLFVADSPIATLLIAASLVLFLRSRESGLVDALAFIANLKYGLWTGFVLVFYFDTFFTQNPVEMYIFLLLSHLGMALQAFLVLDYTDFDWRHLAIAAGWFVLNDLLDYFLDLHTWIYVAHGHPVSPAMVAASGLTLLGTGIAYLSLRDRG